MFPVSSFEYEYDTEVFAHTSTLKKRRKVRLAPTGWMNVWKGIAVAWVYMHVSSLFLSIHLHLCTRPLHIKIRFGL